MKRPFKPSIWCDVDKLTLPMNIFGQKLNSQACSAKTHQTQSHETPVPSGFLESVFDIVGRPFTILMHSDKVNDSGEQPYNYKVFALPFWIAMHVL